MGGGGGAWWGGGRGGEYKPGAVVFLLTKVA